MKLRGKEAERGATLVEAAISFSMLFLLIFVLIEFGLAFKDWLSVSHASREGARAGATFGDDPASDIEILDEVQSILVAVGLENGDQVKIFQAKPGGLETTYSYDPGADCGADPGYSFPDCCDWTPCPEIGRPNYVTPLWDPTKRDVSAPTTDRLGVEIQFTHDWVTGFFGSSMDMTTETDFQIEPQVFGLT